MNAIFTVLITGLLALTPAQATTTTTQKPFEPTVGQAGKDVVWVPTSEALLDKMLDMAKVTNKDFVVDLGSGDGRNIIAAAKRGARGRGVEYNPDMVELSRRKAKEAGVSELATFVQGDMYAAEFPEATVLALFLLPSNLEKLRDKFMMLKPGTRMVLNTYPIPGWEPDVTETITDNCQSWCTSLLYFVPARVGGTWQMSGGEVRFTQDYQMLTGELRGPTAKGNLTGRLKGEEITFTIGSTTYTGRVTGDRMEGTATTQGRQEKWSATRTK
jgi:SAM-dependent methyltransferase